MSSLAVSASSLNSLSIIAYSLNIVSVSSLNGLSVVAYSLGTVSVSSLIVSA